MKNKKGILIVILFIGIFLVGYFFPHKTNTLFTRKDVLPRVENCQYGYINQARCEPDLAPKKRDYVSLRNDLINLIEQKKEEGKVSSVSVYFRDLQNGPTLGIDAQEYFIPASLLKIPLMIMYYEKAEKKAGLLQTKILAEGDLESLDQNIKPAISVEVGKEYTLDELIEILVTQSDNTAWRLLLNHLRTNYSEEDFIETLSDLGIIDPRKRSDQQYITAQSYASIFRILYNASYLGHEMSNKALETLSRSSFKDGIEAGIPDNVLVSHKFGEQRNGIEQQLHDCGLVYYIPNPYILCVMTKGSDIQELEKVIAQVSKELYEEIQTRN